ncbi:MAG: hypothetical protein PF482_08490 [Desulfobacteraceae bacterium]|nr:hypothetical protein [Desulfobacteraceae bacterium]
MNQTMEDKVSIIRESLQAGRADLMEASGSFRVGFESGQAVYIYLETHDNSITARFETKEADPEKRRHELQALHKSLSREISLADISEFAEVSSGNKRFVYTAGICMDESVFFHETIVFGERQPNEVDVLPLEEEASFSNGLEVAAESTIALSPAEEAIESLETIDAKMLRQSLDMMNLRRSSNVRMVLTRIFRSTGDPEELMRAIQNEAGKIFSLGDQEELQMIKTINANEHLAPVIELLHEEVFGKTPGS